MKRLLAGALLSLACGTALAQGAGTILIGQSAPLSGANKDLGVDIRDGALAYFRKVNEAGGVNGRKIELETLDDANVVQRAGENTQKLIEGKRCLRAVWIRQRDTVAPRAAARRKGPRALPCAVHRRRPHAGLQPLRVQHARELR